MKKQTYHCSKLNIHLLSSYCFQGTSDSERNNTTLFCFPVNVRPTGHDKHLSSSVNCQSEVQAKYHVYIKYRTIGLDLGVRRRIHGGGGTYFT